MLGDDKNMRREVNFDFFVQLVSTLYNSILINVESIFFFRENFHIKPLFVFINLPFLVVFKYLDNNPIRILSKHLSGIEKQTSNFERLNNEISKIKFKLLRHNVRAFLIILFYFLLRYGLAT